MKGYEGQIQPPEHLYESLFKFTISKHTLEE